MLFVNIFVVDYNLRMSSIDRSTPFIFVVFPSDSLDFSFRWWPSLIHLDSGVKSWTEPKHQGPRCLCQKNPELCKGGQDQYLDKYRAKYINTNRSQQQFQHGQTTVQPVQTRELPILRLQDTAVHWQIPLEDHEMALLVEPIAAQRKSEEFPKALRPKWRSLDVNVAW